MDTRGVGLHTGRIDEVPKFADDTEIEILRRMAKGNTAGFLAQDDLV